MGDGFKIGDIVMLKTDGCRMVVEKISDEAEGRFVSVVWFDPQYVLHRDSFPAACLTYPEA